MPSQDVMFPWKECLSALFYVLTMSLEAFPFERFSPDQERRTETEQVERRKEKEGRWKGVERKGGKKYLLQVRKPVLKHS